MPTYFVLGHSSIPDVVLRGRDGDKNRAKALGEIQRYVQENNIYLDRPLTIDDLGVRPPKTKPRGTGTRKRRKGAGRKANFMLLAKPPKNIEEAQLQMDLLEQKKSELKGFIQEEVNAQRRRLAKLESMIKK